MAITFVGGVSSANNNGNDVSVTLPGGMAEDDLVLFFGGHNRKVSTSAPGTDTAGYAELFEVDPGDDASLSASWKFMGATPDSSANGLGSGDSRDCAVYTAFAFRGVDLITPIDVTSTTATGSGSVPDAPSITTVTNGAMVVPMFGQRTNDSSVGAPSGYATMSDGTHYNNQTDTRAYTGGGSYLIKATAGAEDPGAFTSMTATNNSARGTVALRPFAVASGNPKGPLGHPLRGPFGGPI